MEIKEGDIVKIDMGVHVDGYIAVVAHTLARPALPRSAPRGAPQLRMNLAPGAGGRLRVARRTLEELPRRSEPYDSPRHSHHSLGPYRPAHIVDSGVLDSGAFHQQVCGQTGVTGRKADVQLAAWTVRHAGRKRLPAGPLPLRQPRRSPAATPAATRQLPRSYAAASPQLARGGASSGEEASGGHPNYRPIGCRPENGPASAHACRQASRVGRAPGRLHTHA